MKRVKSTARSKGYASPRGTSLSPRARAQAASQNSADSPQDAELSFEEQMFQLDKSYTFEHFGEDASGEDVIIDPFVNLVNLPLLRGHTDAVRDMVYDAPNDRLYTASWDDTVLVWELKTGNQVGILPHGVWVNCVALARSPAPLRVITGAEDGLLSVWQVFDAVTGPEYLVTSQTQVSSAAITSLSVYDDGIVFVGSLRRVYAFLLASGSVLRVYRVDDDVNATVCTDDLLLCCCDNGRVVCFDIVGGYPLRELVGHKGPVRCCVVAEEYNTVYTGGDDGAIRVWTLSTGQCQKTWRQHRSSVRALSLHMGESERFLYSASYDGSVRCTRVATGFSLPVRSCTALCLTTAALAPSAADVAAAAEAAKESAAAAAARQHAQERGVRQETRFAAVESRVICGEPTGRIFAFPTAKSEAAVIARDQHTIKGGARSTSVKR